MAATDTDSIIVSIPRDCNPYADMCGELLGQLTDEEPDSEIECIAVGGCKAYGYISHNTTTGERKNVLKVRGITLDHAVSSVLTFEKMKSLVISRRKKSMMNEENDDDTIETSRINFKRSLTSITSVVQQKTYRAINNKSTFEDDNAFVYPFGFIPPV